MFLKSGLVALALVILCSFPAFASFSVTFQSPANTTFTTTFSNPVTVNINYTFGGNESVAPPCTLIVDGVNTTLSLCQNTSISFNVGQHTLNLTANSTLNHTNSTAVNFTVFSNFTFFNQSITSIISNVLVPVSADTWVSDGATSCNTTGENMTGNAPPGTGSIWSPANSTINHGSDVYMAFDTAGTIFSAGTACTISNIVDLWKINSTNATTNAPFPNVVQQKVIESAMFQPVGYGGCQATVGNKTLFTADAATDWNESNITFANCGSICTLTQRGTTGLLTPSLSAPWGSENLVNNGVATNFLSQPAIIQAFYNGTLVTFATNQAFSPATNQCTANNGWNSLRWVATREAPTPDPAQLNLTLVDFLTSGNDYPLFSASFPNFYYDFETGSINSQGAQSQTPLSSSFPQADFSWNTNNILTPLNGATAVLVALQNDSSNSLSNLACASATGYSSAQISNINVPPGTFSVICFNLTANHAGHPFFGAIKVVNATTTFTLGVATGGDFNFYSAIYSPVFTGFSVPIRSPVSPSAGQNVTYTWSTSQPLTTGVQFYSIVNGVSSSVSTIVSNPNLTLSHTYTIDGSNILPNAQIFFRVFGVANDSTTFWSPITDTFNVTGIAGVGNNLSGIIAVSNGGSGGLGVFLFNELGYPISGSVSLDGGNPVHTQPVVCGNCSFPVIFNETVNYTLDKPTVFVAQFTPDLSFIGTHTITAVDDSGYRTRNFTVQISFLPYPLAIRVLPSTCIPYQFFSQSDFCSDGVIGLNVSSIPNATGTFCQYSPNECQAFNLSTGECVLNARHVSSTGSGIIVGGWVQYVCFNGFNSQFYNTTLSAGTTTPITQHGAGAPGSVVPSLTGPLEQILGMTTEQILAIISLIISIAVAVVAGAKTKDGMVAVVVLVTMLLLFSIATWLPFWVAFVISVIAAFMVARFARGFFIGGGGH